MDISMYTTYALNMDFDNPVEAFKHFYNKGVRYSDIVDDELEKYPLHYYCDCLNRAGLKPDALVSMIDITAFSKVQREKNIAIIKGYIDQMDKLGIGILMPAPSVKSAESLDELKTIKLNLIESLSEIVRYADGSGIKVAIENQSSLTRPDSRISDLITILDSVPELQFIFDTGNFFCIGEDVLEALKFLCPKTVHVHCKDWKPDPFGGFVRENIPRFSGVSLGEGEIPLKEIIKHFKNNGYTGNLVLEINSPDITLEMLDKSADFLYNQLNG